MTVYKRGNRWTGRVYLGNRRYKQIGTYDTRREAKEAEAEALRNRARKRSSETVDQFAERWVKDYPRPRTETNKHNASRIRPVARDFKGVRLSDVDRPMAREWAQRNPARLRDARKMFQDALNDGLIDSNPFAGLRMPGSKGRKDETIPTEAELRALADSALATHGPTYGPEFQAMVLFAGYVGVRAGELFGLDWRHVDLRQGEVKVERSYSSAAREFGPPKGGHPRTVFLPPQAREALRSKPRRIGGDASWTRTAPTSNDAPSAEGGAPVFTNKSKPRRIGGADERRREGVRGAVGASSDRADTAHRGSALDDPVFTNKLGGRLTATSHHHLWKPVRKAAGLEHIVWHSLRHVAGTLMAERGLSARDIAWQLGHTDGGRLAQELYVHTYQDTAMARVRDAYETSVKPLRAVQSETEEASGV